MKDEFSPEEQLYIVLTTLDRGYAVKLYWDLFDFYYVKVTYTENCHELYCCTRVLTQVELQSGKAPLLAQIVIALDDVKNKVKSLKEGEPMPARVYEDTDKREKEIKREFMPLGKTVRSLVTFSGEAAWVDVCFAKARVCPEGEYQTDRGSIVAKDVTEFNLIHPDTIQELYDLVWGIDIPSPCNADTREHHEGCKEIMELIRIHLMEEKPK